MRNCVMVRMLVNGGKLIVYSNIKYSITYPSITAKDFANNDILDGGVSWISVGILSDFLRSIDE